MNKPETDTVKAHQLRRTDVLADGTTIGRVTRKTRINVSGWTRENRTVTRSYKPEQDVEIQPRGN